MSNLITASRTCVPPSLELRTMAPALTGNLTYMQTAATIIVQNPWGVELHEMQIDPQYMSMGELGFDFTQEQLLADQSLEQIATLVEGFYRLASAMGSLIVIKHGLAITPEIEDLLATR